jgi:hypothetical protein
LAHSKAPFLNSSKYIFKAPIVEEKNSGLIQCLCLKFLYLQDILLTMRSLLSKSLLVFLLVFSLSAIAQLPDPGGGDTPCGGEFGPCPIPLDGGIGFLVISGLVVGGYKAMKKSKFQD